MDFPNSKMGGLRIFLKQMDLHSTVAGLSQRTKMEIYGSEATVEGSRFSMEKNSAFLLRKMD